MCVSVPVSAAKRRASRLCWAAEGVARIRAWGAPAATAPLAVAPAVAGVGVATDTTTGGGGVLFVRPTTPLSTATRASTPISPVAQASSQARRSDAGTGGAAKDGPCSAGDIGRYNGTHAPPS